VADRVGTSTSIDAAASDELRIDRRSDRADLSPRLADTDLGRLRRQATRPQRRLCRIQDGTGVFYGGGANGLLLTQTERPGAGDTAAQETEVASPAL
jgi:hypothetical protein